MSRLTVSPNQMPMEDWVAYLRKMAERDLPAARRAALLRLVWEESYLTRQGLIARVEALLGRRCFGPSPRAAFYRDMAAVRRALAGASHRLLYSRRRDRKGYYVEGHPLSTSGCGASSPEPWQRWTRGKLTYCGSLHQPSGFNERVR